LRLNVATFGRGDEHVLEGRDGTDPNYSLAGWARPRNMIGKGEMVEANGRFCEHTCSCDPHKLPWACRRVRPMAHIGRSTPRPSLLWSDQVAGDPRPHSGIS